MSYYTYFKLKPEYKKEDKKVPFYNAEDYKTFLKAELIKIYSSKDSVETRYMNIKVRLTQIQDAIEAEVVESILQCMEKEGEYWYNWWDRERDEIDIDSYKNNVGSELLNLTYIPFSSSSDSDTLMDYLRNEYTCVISDQLDSFEDMCYTAAKINFLSTNCTSMTEDEKYDLEKAEKLVQSENVLPDKDGESDSLDNQICTADVETEESTDQS